MKRLNHKRFHIFFLFLLCIIGVRAQNAVKHISNEGEETFFLLKDHPKVSFQENLLSISTDNDRIVLEMYDGSRMEFVSIDNNSVGTIQQDSPIFKIDRDYIEGYNLEPLSNVIITDMAGKAVVATTANNEGFVKVSLSGLPSGVYILTTINKSFKFYKK